MIRDLDDKGLGQNKVLCSLSGIELPMIKLSLQAPRRSLCQRDRFPATCRLLTLKPQWLGFLLVASFLLPLPCRFFLITSFGAFFSVSCRPPSFWFERLSRPGCWSNHWWCGVDSRKSCYRLVRMVLVERADELSKVLDRWGWLPDILFLWISLPWN